jgi:hypothetical protein
MKGDNGRIKDDINRRALLLLLATGLYISSLSCLLSRALFRCFNPYHVILSPKTVQMIT